MDVENYPFLDMLQRTDFGYASDMDITEKIVRLLREGDFTQVKLAETLGVAQSTVARWAAGKVEQEGKNRDAIHALYQSVFGDAPNRVRLVGRVGAGAAVEAIENGGDEWAEAPADVKPSTVAVEVTGNSMYPAYENQTLLYYSKLLPPKEMINRRAVVQLTDGRIFVKVLRSGSEPDSWTLQSLNPNFADIEDVAIEWAAPIDWIKPRS